MSQENVEIMRRLNVAWNARDVEAVRDLHDPGVIVRPIEGWPEPGPFVGREAVLRWFEQLREGWESDSMEEITSTHAGDRVIVRLLWRGVREGVESSMEFTKPHCKAEECPPVSLRDHAYRPRDSLRSVRPCRACTGMLDLMCPFCVG